MMGMIAYSVLMVVIGLFGGAMITIIGQSASQKQNAERLPRMLMYREVYSVLDKFRMNEDTYTAVVINGTIDGIFEQLSDMEDENYG